MPDNFFDNFYILILDDEETLLYSLRSLLESAYTQINIEIASRAQEAWEIFEENIEIYKEPAIIIADQLMPGMKGDEFLIKAHQRFPLAIKILLTGQATASQVGNALNKANLFAFIEKPWNKEDFIQIIKKGLNVFFTRKNTIKLLESTAHINSPQNALEFETFSFINSFLSELINIIAVSKITLQTKFRNQVVYHSIAQDNKYCLDITPNIQKQPEFDFFRVLESERKNIFLTPKNNSNYSQLFLAYPEIESVFLAYLLNNKDLTINIYLENFENRNLLENSIEDIHFLFYVNIINRIKEKTETLNHFFHYFHILSQDNHQWLKQFEDISDHLTMEKQKRLIYQQLNAESNLKIKLLLEQIPGIVWSANNKLEITSLQGKALPPDWAPQPNMTISALFAKQKNSDAIMQAHQKALLGQNIEFEFEYLNRYYKAEANPFRNERGQITGCVVIALDFTEKKENELRLQKLLENEFELNLLKSNFLTLISHSFKTPLSNILLHSELLLRKERPENRKIEYIDIIRKSAHYINELIEDIVLIGQTQSDFELSTKKLIRVADYLDSLVVKLKAMWPEFNEAQINFYDNTQNRYFEIEDKLLSIILQKILINALVYSLPHPIINITLEFQDNYLKFTIEDNGIGIPEEDLPFITEPFFRAKNAPNFLGAGLGLNIVQRILHFKKGSFSIKSQLNAGVTFEFSYPVNAKP
jgi:signal transduction histidine kinase/FixJ family two-component response regulator